MALTIRLANTPAKMPAPIHHLAQINVARMRAPLTGELTAGFVAELAPVNALAGRSTMKLILAIFLTLFCAGCGPDISVNYSVARRAPFNTVQGKTVVTKRPCHLSYDHDDSPYATSPRRDRVYWLDQRQGPGTFALALKTKLLVTDIRHYTELMPDLNLTSYDSDKVFLTIASGPYSGVKAYTVWQILTVLQSPPNTD